MVADEPNPLLWTMGAGHVDQQWRKSDLVANVDLFLDRLGELGIDLDQSNRIVQARKYFDTCPQPQANCALRGDFGNRSAFRCIPVARHR